VVEEADLFGLPGHHGFPQFLGGPAGQTLAFLSPEVHRAFHSVLNVFLQAGGLLPGNASTAQWQQLMTANPASRRAAYMATVQAAQLIDRICKLTGPVSLTAYTRAVWRVNGGI